MIVKRGSREFSVVNTPSRARRGTAATVALLMASLPCTGFKACGDSSGGGFGGGSIGPSSGQVVGAAVGVGAVVAVVTLVAVDQSHHTIKGCVSADSNGLRLLTSDSKLYSIEGDVANVKAGDKVKLHGSRIKMSKNSARGQTFVVKKLAKDYGSCEVSVGRTAKPAE